MLGAQNGGVIRGGLYLKELKEDFTIGDDAFTKSVDNNRQRNLQQFDSPRIPNHLGPIDQDKDDADDFFTQLTNFGKANDKAKSKALAKANPLPSNPATETDLYNQPEINFEYAKPPTEKKDPKMVSSKSEIKTIKKEFSSPQGLRKQPMEMKSVQSSKDFQIVKETQIKVNEQAVKKETLVVEIKPNEKIPASTKSSSSALLNRPQSQAKNLSEKSPKKPEEEKKQSVTEKKPQTPVKSQAKDIQKPEDRILIEVYDDDQPERPSIELNSDNRPVQTEDNTKKDGDIPTQNEIGSPVAMQDFMKQTAHDKNGMVTDRTDMPSLPVINNLPKREETPLDQRKIKNFNLFKDSRRGSVETVNLDMFEDMLAKEVKRGNAPTFKSPRENTEVAFEGFGYGAKKKDLIKGKRSHKSVAIKSTVTAKAIMQAMDKEGLEMNFYQKNVDPIAKLDYMIDHLFG